MKTGIKKILVVAGESGGHVFPAVAFCQDINKNLNLTFVTTKPEKASAWIPSELKPVFLKVDKGLVGISKLILLSLTLIFKVRPDAIIGFGGFITIPFVIFGRILGAKIVIHEQNVIPGKANRFLSCFSHKIAVSFENTRVYFKNSKKVFLTAYPLRRSLKKVERSEALEFFGLNDGVFTVLVMGGSQGASSVNKKFLDSVRINSNISRIQVIHLTGKADHGMVLSSYKGLGIQAKVFDFLNEMNYAYSACDLVVSRSGAGSVFEIMLFGLPSILIPYPYAGAHQAENARILAEKGAALMIEEKNVNQELLSGLLNIFLDDSIRRKAMSSIATSLFESTRNLKLTDLVNL